MKDPFLAAMCLALTAAAGLHAEECGEVPSAQESAEAPAPGSPHLEYAPGRGLLFRTSDGLFEASLGFNLQVRYAHLDNDASAGGVDADQFRVRRFKLSLAGYAWDPRLTYRFQAAFENSGDARLLDDAWLNYRFDDAFALQGGQYKTPFTREEPMNDGVLQFAERAAVVEAFKPSRDIGAMVQGSFAKGLLAYQAGVFGGAGQSTTRTTSHVMPVLRLVANPLGSIGTGEPDLEGHASPALSLGANGFLNTLTKIDDTAFETAVPNYVGKSGWLGRGISLFQTGEDVRIKSWGFDAQLKWRGLFAQAEYLVGQAEGLTSGGRLYAYGWYGEAGYLLLPRRLDVALRYSWVDANRNVARDSVGEVTAALDYYVHAHNFKLQLDYVRTHRQRTTGAPANDQTFLIQAQLMP
ncbi:MAG TPA: porin [Thermoanaerobaculia bacterium]